MTVSSLRTLDPKAFDQRKAQHLLQRAGFGGTPQQVQALEQKLRQQEVGGTKNYKSLKTEYDRIVKLFESNKDIDTKSEYILHSNRI